MMISTKGRYALRFLSDVAPRRKIALFTFQQVPFVIK